MTRSLLLAALLAVGCHKHQTEPDLGAPDTLDDAIADASTGVPNDASEMDPTEEPADEGTVVSAPRGHREAPPDDDEGSTDTASVADDPTEPGAAEGEEQGAPPETREGEAAVKGPPRGLEILPNRRWRIPRSLASRWEEHYRRLGRFKQVDDGWRIRVREYSPGWYLGMRSGDVILEVNGMKLNNKAQLLAAYLKLKKKTEFDVTIRRQGAVRHHFYAIVD